MVMNSFRRSVAADTKKKGSKSKSAWYDKLRLPDSQPGAAIVIVRAEYVDPAPSADQVETDPATGRKKPVINPYYKYRKHRRAMKQGGNDFFADEICSAGYDPYNQQPCVGCFAVDSHDKSVSISDAFAFSVVHLAYYHGHPLLDREKGGIVMKNDNSGPVMIQTECSGRTCNFCRVLRGEPPLPPQQGKDPWPGYDPRSLTTEFGKRRYLDLGKGHLSDLEGIDQVISAQCGNCRSQLTTDGFACPQCNTLIVDMTNDPRSDEQIAQDVIKPYPCTRCNMPVLLKEVVSCDTCASQNAQPLQLSIFDVVIFGMRQGEGTKSHITQGLPHKTIEEFARSIDPVFLKGKSLREYIAELAKPYDFDELMKPRSLQDQAQRLRLPIPAGAGMPQQPGYQPYAGQPQYAPANQQVQQPGQMFQPGFASPGPMAAPPLQPMPQGYPQQQYQQQQPQMGYPQPQQPGPAPFVPIAPPNYSKS